MISRFQWLICQVGGKLWVRASLFCLAGCICALAGIIIKKHMSFDFHLQVSAEAIADVLNIIASSMLAVTIFSLSVMIAAYATASAHATPRSTQLLLADSTAQNALSTFIGSFLFSLVGLIALKMNMYDNNGRVLLLIITLGVILLVILVLLRWIEYLSSLGRLGKTIDTVEAAVAKSLESYISHPCLGACPLPEFSPKDSHCAVIHPTIGYIQHIDIEQLSKLATEIGTEVMLVQRPGGFNDACQPIAYLKLKTIEEAYKKKIQNAITIADERSFEQDPRFGFIVLSEIASNALSPTSNDSGTAISILTVLLRMFSILSKELPELSEKKAEYENVYVPCLKIEDFFNDCFGPIARDAADLIEVGIRLQKTLLSLSIMRNADFKKEAFHYSQYALEHALQSLPTEQDKAMLKSIALCLMKEDSGKN